MSSTGGSNQSRSGSKRSKGSGKSTTDTIRWPTDFLDFLKLLDQHKVKYVIVGGYAVGIHGYIRPTHDLDVFVEISPQNAAALVKVFHEFGFTDSQADEELFLTKGAIVRVGGEALRVEVFNDISGVTFAECFAESVAETVEGIPTRFIGLPQLLTNKLKSGRVKDLVDYDYLTKPERCLKKSAVKKSAKETPRKRPKKK
jgi:predicted nucleotidyltransferase